MELSLKSSRRSFLLSLHAWLKWTFVDLKNKEQTRRRMLKWVETGFKVLKQLKINDVTIDVENFVTPCKRFSRFEINVSVSVWLPFGHCLQLFGVWFTMFWGFTDFIGSSIFLFFLLFGVQVLKPYYYVYDER